MAKNQCNDRTRAFIDENGLRDRVIFAADLDSIWMTRLGILKADPEEIELGVPHPTTLILDRQGIVRFIDVREDFHIWLDPDTITKALAAHS